MPGLGEIVIYIFIGIIALLVVAKGIWPLIGYIVAAGFYFEFKGTLVSEIAFFVMMAFALAICVITIIASEKNAMVGIKKD